MAGNKRQKKGGKTRRSGKGRKLRNTRKNHHMQRGGFTEVCGPVSSGSGASCNAGSGSNYVISLFGDAYSQLKHAISNMF
jgi:hypothetical protein